MTTNDILEKKKLKSCYIRWMNRYSVLLIKNNYSSFWRITIHYNKNITKQSNSYAIRIFIILQCLLQSIKHAVTIKKPQFFQYKTFYPRKNVLDRTYSWDLKKRFLVTLKIFYLPALLLFLETQTLRARLVQSYD